MQLLQSDIIGSAIKFEVIPVTYQLVPTDTYTERTQEREVRVYKPE